MERTLAMRLGLNWSGKVSASWQIFSSWASPFRVWESWRAGALSIARPTRWSATLERTLRLSKVEDAETGYDMMKILYDRRIYANVDGLRNVIRILGRSNEQIRKLKAEDIIDERIARKLEKEGLL